MKQKDVVVGQVYCMKVSGRLQPVRLLGTSVYGGWVGVNELTKRQVRIRSAQKLRYRVALVDGRWRPAGVFRV
jgi:hypothetical protein